MRGRVMVCLFFFCLLICTGCSDYKGQETQSGIGEDTQQESMEEKSQETMGQAGTKEQGNTEQAGQKNTEQIEKGTQNIESNTEEDNKVTIILHDGGENTQKVSNLICEKLWAVNLDVTSSSIDEIKEWLEQAEFVLIGTEKEEAEFEPYMIKYLDSEMFRDKKVSLFFLNENKDSSGELEEKATAMFESYYKGVTMLPSFSMSAEEEMAMEEESRMNGWLTSLQTYDKDGIE